MHYDPNQVILLQDLRKTHYKVHVYPISLLLRNEHPLMKTHRPMRLVFHLLTIMTFRYILYYISLLWATNRAILSQNTFWLHIE